MAIFCAGVASCIHISRDGHYHDIDTSDGIYRWTNGFWPGLLWQMYHATEDALYRNTAEAVEKRLDEALEGLEGLYHDVGFMWLHSAVANYRLMGNEDSRRRWSACGQFIGGALQSGGQIYSRVEC